jgi:hypothetical protein
VRRRGACRVVAFVLDPEQTFRGCDIANSGSQAEGHRWHVAALLVAAGDFNGTAALFTSAQLPDYSLWFAGLLHDAGLDLGTHAEHVGTNLWLHAAELLQAA